MPTPMPSASNSWAREKLAIVSFVLASASAVRSGSLPMSVTTRVTTAAWRAWSSRIEAIDRLGDQRFQLRVVVGPAIGGENPLMLALARRRLRHGAVGLCRRAAQRRGG